MAYNPQYGGDTSIDWNYATRSLQGNVLTLITKPDLNSYEAFYTSYSTGTGGYVQITSTSKKLGYQIDLCDVVALFDVGDTVKVGNSSYSITSKITSEINGETGIMTSFQNIEDTPLLIDPETPRTYRFDISINRSDI